MCIAVAQCGPGCAQLTAVMLALLSVTVFMFVSQGVNPDVKYEVQYSSYVNVTSDGFMILKRVVKTESFALQVNGSQ